MKWLGVDTGGTFTDLVLWYEQELRVHKVLSTPAAPERAILQGMNELRLQADIAAGGLLVIHGSTVATNAALQRKGVKTAYIANKGLKDVLTIGRQARPELYNLTPDTIDPPVPAELCFELNCRIDAQGNELVPLGEEELDQLKARLQALAPTSVAVNFLFSFLNDSHEQKVRRALEADFNVSCSAEVLPEYKEYERGIATWLNAWLGPVVQRYLRRLESRLRPCPVAMMQSSGGTISIDQAADRAVQLMLSGPAGGLAAAVHLGKALNRTRLLTFDMGGTSTDVALLDGGIRLTSEGKIAGYPVAVPSVDMHTIGAGGGSVGWLDRGGMLRVGPESAGADPGPACYGKGGDRPTVTDANLILGRIPESVLLGGTLPLSRQAAIAALAPVAEKLGISIEALALGIVNIANEHMVRALRVISVFRGYRPQDFALFCFGGAGGLHVCDLAEELGMKEAVFPAYGGVLSAFGMLVAPKQRNFSQTMVIPLSQAEAHQVTGALQKLTSRALRELAAEQVVATECKLEWMLACRYLGQSFTLDLPFWQGDISFLQRFQRADEDGFAEELMHRVAEHFHQAHEKRFGYRLTREVELVTLNCRVFAEVSPPQLPRVEVSSPQLPRVEVLPQQNGLQGALADSGDDSQHGSPKVIEREGLRIGDAYDGPLIITDKVSTLFLKEKWTLCRDETDHLLLTRH